MTFEYTHRWGQLADFFQDPIVVERLEARDRELESHLNTIGDCTAFFFYRYRWDQIYPLIWSNPLKAVELLEEHDREFEDHMYRSTGTNCRMEYTYRWPQVIGLLTKNDPHAFVCLESNDQAIEHALGQCVCGGCEWKLRFSTGGTTQSGDQTVSFVMPIDCELPTAWHFSCGALGGDMTSGDGSVAFFTISGAEIGLAYDSWNIVGDAGFTTDTPLFTSTTGMLRAGDTITFEFSPEPYDGTWDDVVAELTFSCCWVDENVTFGSTWSLFATGDVLYDNHTSTEQILPQGGTMVYVSGTCDGGTHSNNDILLERWNGTSWTGLFTVSFTENPYIREGISELGTVVSAGDRIRFRENASPAADYPLSNVLIQFKFTNVGEDVYSSWAASHKIGMQYALPGHSFVAVGSMSTEWTATTNISVSELAVAVNYIDSSSSHTFEAQRYHGGTWSTFGTITVSTADATSLVTTTAIQTLLSGDKLRFVYASTTNPGSIWASMTDLYIRGTGLTGDVTTVTW